MTIGDILQVNSIDAYKKLMQISKTEKPKKKIELGDSVENLMKADSYKREGRRIKQKGWS